jgi:hypothetical protein
MRYPGVIISLKSYYHDCSGQDVPYHTASPHGLIPHPIKRARTLVKLHRGYRNLGKFYFINTVKPVAVAAKLVAR